MVFKGTTTRSAQQFAREVDGIGGNLDAFTGKETVCFNIKVLDENYLAALDLLTDLVLHPTFAAEDIAKEQGVILEEIKMDEDNPDYLVHELFSQKFWKGDALGRPILGTVATVSSFDQATVLNAYADRFTSANMVFTAAGNIDHDAFVAARSKRTLPRSPPPRRAAPGSAPPLPTPQPAHHHQEQESRCSRCSSASRCRRWPCPTRAATPPTCSTRSSAPA